MLEVIICDDEKIFRNDLKKVVGIELDLCGFHYHITEFSSGEELVSTLTENKKMQKIFQNKLIIFLDIEMKKLNGIDTAKEIRKVFPFVTIIFVTSHSDFVFQGYEVQAFQYILKPYEREKIISVLHIALEKLDLTKETSFLVEQQGGTICIPYHSIQYFYSERHSIFLVSNMQDSSEKISFYGKLGDIQETLPDCFTRIHNRYLINLKYLNEIKNNIAIIDKEQLPISRSYKHDLSIAYARYMLH